MRINEDFLDVEQLDDVVGNDVQVDAEQSYRFVMNIGLHNSYRLPELLSSYSKIAQRLHRMGIENFYCDKKVYKFEFMTPTDVPMNPKEVESSDSGYIRV